MFNDELSSFLELIKIITTNIKTAKLNITLTIKH